jgi:hypothetical protein
MSDVIPFKKPLKSQDLVLRFLTSIGHKRDAEVYLKLFTSQKPESFAIIVVNEEVLREEIHSVIFELRYLMRLSLFPIVLVQTTDDFLQQIDLNQVFKRAKIGISLLSDQQSLEQRIHFIQERIRKETLPMIHIDPKQNLITELTQLANTLRTNKVIFLKKVGGILNQNTSEIISIINMRFESTDFMNSVDINNNDKDLLQSCHQLIEKCDHKIFTAVVNPNNLLRELFTVKGAGTLIQLGSNIISKSKWDDIDPKSLRRLLEMSFDKKIKDSLFNKKIDHFYIEENYMGAAMIQEVDGLAYLSKFAVGTEARGLGIGRDLWTEITKHHQKIFWRSNPDKFITNWYVKQCDGMHKTKDWVVFWKGIDQSKITSAIEFALSQEVDFSK